MSSNVDAYKLVSPYERTELQQIREDQLNALDSEIGRLGALLQKAIDGDSTICRHTDDHTETQRVSLELGIDFELEAGDSLETELVWFLECLAGALGRKVVAK